MPQRNGLPSVTELDEKSLRCTKAGQVLLEYPNAKNLMDVIKEYFLARQEKDAPSVSSRYYGKGYPDIKNWLVTEYNGNPMGEMISWQKINDHKFDDIEIDHYLLYHSGNYQIPILYFHAAKNSGKTVLWLNLNGKASQEHWPQILQLIKRGENVISFDFRGTGEDRMLFEATSADNLTFATMDSTQIYFNPLSGVFANYIYNQLLIGRPYFLQMIEDTEIVSRFVRSHLNAKEIKIMATPETRMLAREIVATLPDIKPLSQADVDGITWSEIVTGKLELWLIQNLLPGGAFLR
jgi:hypothetical protein